MSLKDFKRGLPQFCTITPVQYLEDYATQSSVHLVLAHIVDKDPVYADFYLGMSERGDRIIMDNGAFELGESYAPDKLIELGHRCGADAIVLPDYPNQDPFKTIDAAMKLAPSVKSEGFKAMFAPQAKIGDLDGWIESYTWAADSDLIDIIGMSILAIPNALPLIPKSYARVVMTELLHDRDIFAEHKFHHYLGLNAAPNVEIPSLILTNSLDSCDSSNPVWAGINGHQYNTVADSFLPISKKYLREVDFDYEWVDKDHIHDMIQYNLNITFDIFKNPLKYKN
ncbi:MAG: hypothetical protein CTY12_03405 [Methylotenera sp.]|nr:MAG: hypothetical protein CTY12_03405 [Methylotenera sp.]